MVVPLLFKSSQDTNREVRLTSPEGSHRGFHSLGICTIWQGRGGGGGPRLTKSMKLIYKP